MLRTSHLLRRAARVAAVIVLLSLAAPLASAHATGAIASLPFKAFYTETYGLPPCTPQACTYPGRGTGFTTATGAMTETTALTLMPAVSTGCHLAQSTTTFTDAQGNQLTASANGAACPISANGPLAVALRFTITGGTGTYRNAGGMGREAGWVYLQNSVGPPVASFVWNGVYTPCAPCAAYGRVS